jgi:hypothetical protein
MGCLSTGRPLNRDQSPKSNTEAELIALSATGGEMEWWTRVFKYVKFNPEIQPLIYYGNEQTVGIVKKENE